MKRLVDIVFSAIGLILLSPFFCIVALWVKLDTPGPILFRQVRVGKDGKTFRIFKFRTMVADAEYAGHQITVGDDPRITKSGRFLRSYKLDEFPQLLNVFFGDMSMVGPRPEVPRYVEMFKDAYKAVLQVKPGITDFAAVEFSNEEEVLKKYDRPEEGYIKEVLPRKIELYKKYLKEKCFRTDMKLIILTLKKLL